MDSVTSSKVYTDLNSEELVEHALRNNEGVLSSAEALTVKTGKRTCRSPKDRFIVKDAETENTVHWDQINQPFPSDAFEALWQRTMQYLSNRPSYVAHLRVGADEKFFLPLKVITETAWHNLFARNLFIRSTDHSVEGRDSWTVLNVPGFTTNPKRDQVNSDGAVILNLSQRKVLLVGMHYAGEMKKAM